MWRILGKSVIGTSHEISGTPCQDAHLHELLEINGKELLLVAISDGAGSAQYSERGASFVVTDWLRTASDALLSGDPVTESAFSSWATRVKENLTDYSIEQGIPLKEYSCTLLAAVIQPESTWVFQVGDGAWVAKMDDRYQALTWPFQGEYAAETVFLSSETAEKYFQIASFAAVAEIAGFTDGLERLALVFKDKSVHPAFFEGMFKTLRQNEPEQLAPQLDAFLRSEAVTSRTDDDKTLVLVTVI